MTNVRVLFFLITLISDFKFTIKISQLKTIIVNEK